MKYPEHTKLDEVKDQSQAIGEFLDWLTNEQGVVLAKWQEGRIEDRLMPTHEGIQDLLARYFDIDQNKLEQEKRQMLKEAREAQERRM